jgi:hypothetical protein
MRLFLVILALLGSFSSVAAEPDVFVPTHILPGLGAGRQGLNEQVLAARTEQMIQSQTFAIIRDPRALAGAQRIQSPQLQKIFRDASRKSGVPATLLAALAYLESYGDPKAESPAGPRGIVQISEATAKRIGLKVVRAKRYRVITTKQAVRNKKGKLTYRTTRRRERYEVTARDDRLIPERAVPAAAKYLASMEAHYGGLDWAIFAYHCGEGCVGQFRSLVEQSEDLGSGAASVAKMFFSCHPAYNTALCDDIRQQMARDYSPTYWFRVMRAEQLLALYEEDPASFRALFEEYRFRADPAQRAPDRLAVWLTPADLTPVSDPGLTSAPNAPDFLGFRPPPGTVALASPAALGTLLYIAYETRRLFAAMAPGETFVPLEVAGLLRAGETTRNGLDEHGTGQVIDIALNGMPAGERYCLHFVLEDLGWNGNLGFIEEPDQSNIMHIGCAPSSRTFFSQVFHEAEAVWKQRVASTACASTPGGCRIPLPPEDAAPAGKKGEN